ncbi:MAG: hypothetical protein AAGA26_06420 [Pseudomonadota bacterium]
MTARNENKADPTEIDETTLDEVSGGPHFRIMDIPDSVNFGIETMKNIAKGPDEGAQEVFVNSVETNAAKR